MTTAEPLEIRKSRDLGEQLNFTFNFLRANFKRLFKAIAVIVGPAMLLTSGLLGYSLFGFYGFEEYDYNPVDSVPILVIGVLCAIASTVLLLAVINEYVLLYLEREGENFEVEDVWHAVRKDLGRVIVTLLGLGAVFGIAYALMIAVLAIGSIFFIFFVFFFFIGIIYVAIPMSLLIPVRLSERDLTFGASLSRCFELVKERWWVTFVLFFALYLVANFVSTFLYIPFMFLTSFIGLSFDTTEGYGDFQIVMVIFMTLIVLVSYLSSALPTLGAVLHYYNLVEKVEGSGLMERISAIGSDDEPEKLDASIY
jgi:hypothetical protein